MRSIRGVPVCVVGGAGFLGSHCVNHLIEDRGCKVLVIDNLVAGRREFVHKDAEFVHHDITGSEVYLYNLFKTKQIEYVLNYAAYPYIPDSFTRPKHVCEVNFNGAINVINAAHEAGCKGILQVSSAEIFGGTELGKLQESSGGKYIKEFEDRRLDENAPVQPHSSYGVSKAAVDAYVQVRWREAKVPCIALRQFNAYGPRETHDYVIPTIISQIHRNGPVVRLGNNSSRDFQFATDAVRATVELLERGEFGSVYNLGSEDCIKIYDLAVLIGELMGHPNVKVVEDESRKRPWEIWALQADCSKIKSVIEYRHQTSFEDGLKHTIKDFIDGGAKWCWEK